MCWSQYCFLWPSGHGGVARGICSVLVVGGMVRGGGVVSGLSVAGGMEGGKGTCGYGYMLGFIGWV